MKIINITSAYASDGKSCIAKLLSEDFSKINKKTVFLDNSIINDIYSSGFRRMYDIKNIPGIDAVMPFLKGEILDYEQLSEIMVLLNEDLHYIPNSEIDALGEIEIKYIISILEKENKYDVVLIENTFPIHFDEFDVFNIFVTRPCEKILGNIKNIKKDYQLILINKFEEDFNMTLPKNISQINYDKEIVLMENGYKCQLDIKTERQIKKITEHLFGFALSDETSSVTRKNKIFELFRK